MSGHHTLTIKLCDTNVRLPEAQWDNSRDLPASTRPIRQTAQAVWTDTPQGQCVVLVDLVEVMKTGAVGRVIHCLYSNHWNILTCVSHLLYQTQYFVPVLQWNTVTILSEPAASWQSNPEAMTIPLVQKSFLNYLSSSGECFL